MILSILPGFEAKTAFGAAAFADVFIDFTTDSLLAGAAGVMDASGSFALTLEVFDLVITSPWVAAANSLPPPQAPNGASPWGWKLPGCLPGRRHSNALFGPEVERNWRNILAKSGQDFGRKADIG
jgi:hypothetical protein